MRAELTYLVEQYRAIREALNENKNNLPEEEIWDLFASQETRIIAVLIEANQYRAHDFLEWLILVVPSKTLASNWQLFNLSDFIN